MAFVDLQEITATIAAGQSLSGQVNLGNATLVAISMPSTSWSTAGLTFQASPDGGTTWQEVYFSDPTISAGSSENLVFAVTASEFVLINPTLLRGLNCIKVRSGTSGSPVTQSAGAVITLIARGFN